MSFDHDARIAAFTWLSQQVNIHGDVLSRELLATGFVFQNIQVPIVSPQGIFKPKLFEFPLSITSTTQGPYNDSFNESGFLLYRYRGTDSYHRDNTGLRESMNRTIPLIYCHSIVPGKYLVEWPVYIIADNPSSLTFTVALEEYKLVDSNVGIVREDDNRRAYLTSQVRIRLYQREFRVKVINAYQSQCALCRLKHVELLDAAHIIPDNEPESKPIVSNGISLCKLHHAAFDSFMIGITPEYKIELRKDILDEHDGPMLQHGLKELHDHHIILPKYQNNWPDQGYLDWRYQRFKSQ